MQSKSFRDAMKAQKKKATKALRKGVTNANKILVRAVKAKTPVDTKALKKSMGQKVKQYRKGTVVVGIVGPRVGDAAKYGPAVEKGHGTYRGAQMVRGTTRDNETALQAAMAQGAAEVLNSD